MSRLIWKLEIGRFMFWITEREERRPWAIIWGHLMVYINLGPITLNLDVN